MRYLVDSSALTRIIRRQVDPVWHELVQRGLLSLCEPVLAETLQIADTKEYAETETSLTDTYVPVTIPDGVWDLSAAIRHELAPRSAHQGLSVADLVVAATAIKLKLTVLHEDADYETVGRFVPQLRQRRISLGPEAAW
jgi:predicted nucleic acid-binding protein